MYARVLPDPVSDLIKMLLSRYINKFYTCLNLMYCLLLNFSEFLKSTCLETKFHTLMDIKFIKILFCEHLTFLLCYLWENDILWFLMHHNLFHRNLWLGCWFWLISHLLQFVKVFLFLLLLFEFTFLIFLFAISFGLCDCFWWYKHFNLNIVHY